MMKKYYANVISLINIMFCQLQITVLLSINNTQIYNILDGYPALEFLIRSIIHFNLYFKLIFFHLKN